MLKTELSKHYRNYIACLNRQDWASLFQFVHDDVIYNNKAIGLAGYRDMLAQDFDEIPDLRFAVELLVCDSPCIASRLSFDCTPKAKFLGLAVNGKRVSFAEKRVLRFP